MTAHAEITLALTGILAAWVLVWSTRLVRTLQISPVWVAALMVEHIGAPLAVCLLFFVGHDAIAANKYWMFSFALCLLAPIIMAAPFGNYLNSVICRFYQDRLPARMRHGFVLFGLGGTLTVPTFGALDLAYQAWSIEQDVRCFGLTAAGQVDATVGELAFRSSGPPLLDLVFVSPVIWYAWFYDDGLDSRFFAILVLAVFVARNILRMAAGGRRRHHHSP